MVTLTEARWETLLAYCKLTELADDPEVAALLPGFYAAAVGYLEGAGVSMPEEGTPRRAQYDLLVNFLTLERWERRDTMVTTTGGSWTENPAFRRTLNQLKLTEPDVSDSDTSG